MLVQRADVNSVDPLVGVGELRDDKGIKWCRANIDRDTLVMLILLPIDGLDFVGKFVIVRKRWLPNFVVLLGIWGTQQGGGCTGPRSLPIKRRGLAKALDEFFRGPNWWASWLQLSWRSFSFAVSSFGSKWDRQPPYQVFGVASARKRRHVFWWSRWFPSHACVGMLCLFWKFRLGPHLFVTSLDNGKVCW